MDCKDQESNKERSQETLWWSRQEMLLAWIRIGLGVLETMDRSEKDYELELAELGDGWGEAKEASRVTPRFLVGAASGKEVPLTQLGNKE